MPVTRLRGLLAHRQQARVARIARHPGGGALQLGAQRGDVGDQGHQFLDLHPYFYTLVP